MHKVTSNDLKRLREAADAGLHCAAAARATGLTYETVRSRAALMQLKFEPLGLRAATAAKEAAAHVRKELADAEFTIKAKSDAARHFPEQRPNTPAGERTMRFGTDAVE